MSTAQNQFPGNDNNNQQNTSSQQGGSNSQEDVQVSLPRIDRPEGPFEHSGETAGWTAEEEREKVEKEEQQS
jgi:hypothetical protein